MTVPIIDGIDHETFEYRSVYQGHEHFRGIFEWGMLYKVSRLGDCSPTISRRRSCRLLRLPRGSTTVSRTRVPHMPVDSSP